MIFLRLLAVAVLLYSCGGPSLLSKKELSAKFNYNFEKSAKKYANDGAVIIADNNYGTVRLDADYNIYNKYIKERYIHYINSNGEKFTNYKNRLFSRFWSPHKIIAKTIGANGQVTELPSEQIKINTITTDAGYQIKEIEFSFPNVTENCILYFYYELISQDNYLINYDYFVQEEIPVLSSKFELTVPVIFSEWKQEYLTYFQNINQFQPEIEKNIQGKQTFEKNYKFTYKMYNIPAFKREKYSRPKNHVQKYMQFFTKDARNKNWDSEIFGIKARKINYSDELKPGKFVEKFITEKIGELPKNKESIVDKVYQAIQDNFEALNSPWYRGGKVKPSSVEKTLGNFYNESKNRINIFDINALAVVILRKLGFEARMALVKNINDGPFFVHKVERFDLTDMLTTVKIAGKTFWLDFTEEFYIYSDISPEFQGIKALILDDKNRKTILSRVDIYDRSLNEKSVNITANINEDHELSGKIEINLKGNTSFYFRNKFNQSSEKEKEDEIKKYLYRLIGTSEIESFKVSDFDLSSKKQKITISFFKENVISKIGNEYYIKPYILNDKIFDKVDFDKRKSDIFLYYPWYDISKITISYPKSMKISKSPVRKRFSMDRIKYTYTMINNYEEQKIEVMRILDLNAKEIQKRRFKELKNFISNVNESNNSKLGIKL